MKSSFDRNSAPPQGESSSDFQPLACQLTAIVLRLSFIAFTLSPVFAVGETSLNYIDSRAVLVGTETQDCAHLAQDANAIIRWSELTESRQCAKRSILRSSTAFVKCYTDMTDCLPRVIREHLGRETYTSGPNCWNMALVFSGIVPSFRYSPPEEMTYYMNSPLCSPVPEAQLRPGDIGVYRDSTKQGSEAEVHAFLHVSKDVIFSKRNLSFLNPYEIISYSTERERQAAFYCGGKPDCHLTTRYFRCESTSAFMARKPFNTNVRELARQLEMQEGLQEQYVLGQSPADKSENEIVLSLKSQLKSILIGQHSLSEDDRFLIDALMLRADQALAQKKTVRVFLTDPNRIPPYRIRKDYESLVRSSVRTLMIQTR